MKTAAHPQQFQTTIRSSVKCQGVGVHSGAIVNLTLYPAEANTGIIFNRIDAPQSQGVIAARFDQVRDTRLCTTITNKHGYSVSTIEHLMSALYATGIDNIRIDIDGSEVPIMDGSASPFLFLLDCAGIKTLSAARSYIQVIKTVTVTDGPITASLMPGQGFSIDCTIDFTSRVIGQQHYTHHFSAQNFRTDIARARTFGHALEVEKLRSMGLARGGSLDNAVVIDDERVLNPEGLRYKDEFVRHKVLDVVGDLYLAGAPIIGCYTSHRPSHTINNMLLRALLADKTAWCFTTQTASKINESIVTVQPLLAALA